MLLVFATSLPLSPGDFGVASHSFCLLSYIVSSGLPWFSSVKWAGPEFRWTVDWENL
jgi:hypothetical protein